MTNEERILEDIPIYPDLISQLALSRKHPEIKVKYFIKNLPSSILIAEDDNLNYCYASNRDKEYSINKYKETKGDK